MEHILIILPINKGTLARRALDLNNLFLEKGLDVKVLVLSNPKIREFDFKNISYFHFKLAPFIDEFFKIIWVTYKKYLFSTTISISVVDSCSVINVLSFGKSFNIGVFRAPVEQLTIWNNRKKLTDFSYKYIFPRLDRLFTVSAQVKKSIIENYPVIDSNKIETVYNVFDIDKIEAKSLEKIEILTIDFSLFTIINVGRIEKIKEQRRIIDAVRSLDIFKKGLCNLVFVGDFGTDYYQTIADSNFEKDKIYFVGNQINPYKFIKKSNLFILSSLQEGLPGALIESLLLKVPSIATNCSSGVWEIMDVFDRYDESLSTPIKTQCGFIIPNSSQFNQFNNDEQLVVECMSKCIEMAYEEKQENWNFDCVKKFIDVEIANKYIIK